MTWCFLYNISLSYFLSYRFYVILGAIELFEALGEYLIQSVTLASEIGIFQKLYFLPKPL